MSYMKNLIKDKFTKIKDKFTNLYYFKNVPILICIS